MTPLADVLRWTTALSNEVARLPGTIGRARRVVGVLPEHLEALLGALDGFTSRLDAGLGDVRAEIKEVGGRLVLLQESIDVLTEHMAHTTSEVDVALPALTGTVLRLEQRLVGMQEAVDELGGTVVGTISAVPVLRRATRRTSPRASQDVVE